MHERSSDAKANQRKHYEEEAHDSAIHHDFQAASSQQSEVGDPSYHLPQDLLIRLPRLPSQIHELVVNKVEVCFRHYRCLVLRADLSRFATWAADRRDAAGAVDCLFGWEYV